LELELSKDAVLLCNDIRELFQFSTNSLNNMKLLVLNGLIYVDIYILFLVEPISSYSVEPKFKELLTKCF